MTKLSCGGGSTWSPRSSLSPVRSVDMKLSRDPAKRRSIVVIALALTALVGFVVGAGLPIGAIFSDVQKAGVR